MWHLAYHWHLLHECKNDIFFMNARMTSLEPLAPPESMALLSYSSWSLSSVLLPSAFAMLAFLSVGWPALRGLSCCKHECLAILPFTLSLLLLFKCCFSPWSFKYLFSSGTRIFLSLVNLQFVGPLITKAKTVMRELISAAERLTPAIHYLAYGDSQKPTTFSYRIARSTIFL